QRAGAIGDREDLVQTCNPLAAQAAVRAIARARVEHAQRGRQSGVGRLTVADRPGDRVGRRGRPPVWLLEQLRPGLDSLGPDVVQGTSPSELVAPATAATV